METADKCIHLINLINDEKKNKVNLKIKQHAKGINDFIYKYKNSKEYNYETLRNFIKKDIETGKPIYRIHKIFDDYKTILNNRLINNYKDLIKEENDSKEIIKKIEDYILQRSYKYMFPKTPLEDDTSFYQLTISYDWIPSTYFGVKVDLPLDSIQDSITYTKLIEERAFSINEKIKYFRMILNNINKINEFYCGIAGKSADDQTPVYTYIILKSHPKRFISNINYVKCLTEGKKLNEPEIVLFINNSMISFKKILEVTPYSLKIDVHEFNRRNNEAINRLSKL